MAELDTEEVAELSPKLLNDDEPGRLRLLFEDDDGCTTTMLDAEEFGELDIALLNGGGLGATIILLSEDDGTTTELDAEDGTVEDILEFVASTLDPPVLTTLAELLLAVGTVEFVFPPPQAVNKVVKQATPIK